MIINSKSNFFVSLIMVIFCLSHLISFYIYYITIVSSELYAFMYFGLTIPIAIIIVYLKKIKLEISQLGYFVLSYVVSVIFFGGFVSLLFLAPNYCFANRKQDIFIKSDIIKVGVFKSEYTKESYILTPVFGVRKKIYFPENYHNKLIEVGVYLP